MKFPKIPYLSCSPNVAPDDPVVRVADLEGCHLIATLKMDGSNVQITREHVAARNGETANHPSFDLLKQQHAGWRHKIPQSLVFFGEWLYAKHSIHYVGDLALVGGYLQIFAAYDRRTDLWLGWATVAHLSYLFPQSPLRSTTWHWLTGLWGDPDTATLTANIVEAGEFAIDRGHEGIVLWPALPFPSALWARSVAKYVRTDHVQTDEHWRRQPIVRNELRNV